MHDVGGVREKFPSSLPVAAAYTSWGRSFTPIASLVGGVDGGQRLLYR